MIHLVLLLLASGARAQPEGSSEVALPGGEAAGWLQWPIDVVERRLQQAGRRLVSRLQWPTDAVEGLAEVQTEWVQWATASASANETLSEQQFWATYKTTFTWRRSWGIVWVVLLCWLLLIPLHRVAVTGREVIGLLSDALRMVRSAAAPLGSPTRAAAGFLFRCTCGALGALRRGVVTIARASAAGLRRAMKRPQGGSHAKEGTGGAEAAPDPVHYQRRWSAQPPRRWSRHSPKRGVLPVAEPVGPARLQGVAEPAGPPGSPPSYFRESRILRGAAGGTSESGVGAVSVVDFSGQDSERGKLAGIEEAGQESVPSSLRETAGYSFDSN